MSTTPFPNLPSGQNFVPEVSGASFLGSASSPFGTVYANALSGVTIPQIVLETVSGIQIGDNSPLLLLRDWLIPQ
jgi:hypothetical protein